MKFKMLFIALSLASAPLLASAMSATDTCNRNNLTDAESLQTAGPIARNGIAKVAPLKHSGPSTRNGIAKVAPLQHSGPSTRNGIAKVDYQQAYGPTTRKSQGYMALVNRRHLYAANISGGSW